MKIALLALAAAVVFVAWLYWPLPGLKARDAVGQRKAVERDGRTIAYFEAGEGPTLVMIASLGREASDFNELSDAVVAAGYRAVAIAPPGTDGSGLPDGPMDLSDLADDVAAVLDHLGLDQDETATVLGHAFGNRVARMTATGHGARINGVITVAAGGKRTIEPKAREALMRCFDPRLPGFVRRAAVRYGFFADGNPIPDYWLRGWHVPTSRLQAAATQATDSALWWSAGDKPLLVIQAMQDRIAPPQDTADLLEAELGERVEVVRIEQAGHALLPEAPDAIADAVIAFLKARA